ncbi:peptidoglycan-binding protein [Falsirhodobacter sp. alg1]|uniref:peptidoglycan-binding domain-containing protein n=1 Tax=Falsirhodobacter sp. alg1 TaxID=1472418 RepID=UPI000786A65E|nr:peptidoglycan-binding domain-containing protein [Falsirhodobacter sp. alg1]
MHRFALVFALLLAGCGYPHVPDPVNPDLRGKPRTTEPKGTCWEGADTARTRVFCDGDYTAERVQTLQRALAARGQYTGPADGKLGASTKAAIRSYQVQFGHDGDMLTWQAAEALGVVSPFALPEEKAAP